MGLSQEEVKEADDALKVAAGVPTTTAQDGVTQTTTTDDVRVSQLESQVTGLTERLRQVESFITRKYPYG